MTKIGDVEDENRWVILGLGGGDRISRGEISKIGNRGRFKTGGFGRKKVWPI